MEGQPIKPKGKFGLLTKSPTDPDAPVSSQIHLNIIKRMDSDIRGILDKTEQLHLVGLKISYQFIRKNANEPEEYSMVFGRDITEGNVDIINNTIISTEFLFKIFEKMVRDFQKAQKARAVPGTMQGWRMCACVLTDGGGGGYNGGTLNYDIACDQCDNINHEHCGQQTKHQFRNGHKECMGTLC